MGIGGVYIALTKELIMKHKRKKQAVDSAAKHQRCQSEPRHPESSSPSEDSETDCQSDADNTLQKDGEDIE
jgi:hypothetical protein